MNVVALGTAFFGGLVSFLAPCILPIIPGFLAYLAGSNSTNGEEPKRRDVFITSIFFVLGFSVVFALIGVLLNTVLVHVAVSLQVWLSRIGGVLIIFFGLYLTGVVRIPYLDRDHKFGVKKRFSSHNLTSFLFGLAFAAGWTPCVGPVLGVVLGLAASAPTSAFILLLTYALGLGIPFLIVGLFTAEATRLIARFGASLKVVNIIFGLILIVVGVLVFLQRLTFTFHSPMPNTPVVTVEQATSTAPTASRAGFLSLQEKAAKYQLAKEITTPDGFINTPDGAPIKISDYIGKKVILIDFWTYSCINCQRTLPYLEGWYKKYEDQGFVVIGIHTPEFEFEKDYNNVKSAVANLGVTFPVVLDNDYSTWNAYNNHYWPHKYLIDIDGFVTYDHVGEGSYDEAEAKIQEALKERAAVLGTGQTISGGTFVPGMDEVIDTQSPETYFGWARNEFLGNGTPGIGGVQSFTLPSTLVPNKLYLGGTWDVQKEYAQTASSDTKVGYYYSAKNIYWVASAPTSVTVKVFQDGVLAQTLTVQEAKLYTLMQNGTAGPHSLRLEIMGKGLEAFTFTFG